MKPNVRAVLSHDPEAGQVKKEWENMNLRFVSKTVKSEGLSSGELREHVESILRDEGDPVRWAIVEAKKKEGTCRVDAVVSQ